MSEEVERMSESVSSLESVDPRDQAQPPSAEPVAEGVVMKIRGGVVDVLFSGTVPRIQDLL